MKINRKKIDKAILDIKLLQRKYAKMETMFIYRALDGALKTMGWDYAELLTKDLQNERRPNKRIRKTT